MKLDSAQIWALAESEFNLFVGKKKISNSVNAITNHWSNKSN